MDNNVYENKNVTSDIHASKHLIILIGNYGSGKTELSLNFALKGAKEGKRTALVDLDIVNPYFRSSEQEEMLSEAGVRLIAAPFGGSKFGSSKIDLPIVSAEVAAAFDDDSLDYVVFDVGGDPVGATALGRYYPNFTKFGLERVLVYFVVNIRRPLTRTVEDLLTLFDQVQNSARIPIGGFINNANLANETTAQDLLDGQKIIKELSEKTGKPLIYTTGWRDVLDAFIEKTDMPDFVGELMEVQTFMRPEWLDTLS